MPENNSAPMIKSSLIFGFSVVGVFFGGFLLWSLLAPLDSAAIAPGKITVDSNRKTIQHLEGGIIKAIHVRDGQLVKKGDLILELEPTQAHASLDMYQGQATELLATEARLKAQRDESDKIIFPDTLLKNKNNPDVASILSSQEKILAANNKAMSGQMTILNQRIEQLNKEIESLQAQAQAETTQWKLIQEEITAVAYLEKRKLIEKPRLLALQREAARLEGDKGEHLGLIAKAQEKIGETKSQMITIKDTDQKNTLDKLDDTQSKLADIVQKKKSAQDISNRTQIFAPQTGRVVDLKYHTIGGVVQPGEELLSIIPSDDKLIVEAKVSPLDIDVVHKGLQAKVRFTAFKQRSTPTVDGDVVDVSADIIEDKATNTTYYNARIEIANKELFEEPHLKLYPGMPVQVMIIVDKRTPFGYFWTPITESFHRAFREQ